MNRPNLWLAILCAIGAVSLATCYAGGMGEETKGEFGSIVMGVVLAAGAVFFYLRRDKPIT